MAFNNSIDNRIVQIFQAIQNHPEVALQYEFHPSECENRVSNPESFKRRLFAKKKQKLIEVINEYHVYCKVCRQHLYSRSKQDDINSFFQPHLNSVTHIWKRKCEECDVSAPIFVWQKWLYTGFCKICSLSGIDAFVIETDLDIFEIVNLHFKGFRHCGKVSSSLSIGMNRILPTLDIFADLCIKYISIENYVCKICQCIINGTQNLVNLHLASSEHYRNFIIFISTNLSFSPVELLERENVEMLLRKILIENFTIKDPEKIYRTEIEDDYIISSDEESEEMQIASVGVSLKKLGFSPKKIKELLAVKNEDLLIGSYCLLCEEYDDDLQGHLSSNSHRLRKPIFIWDLINNPNYNGNRNERLSKYETEISKYEKYKALLNKKDLNFGIAFKPEYIELCADIDNRYDHKERHVEKEKEETGNDNDRWIEKASSAQETSVIPDLTPMENEQIQIVENYFDESSSIKDNMENIDSFQHILPNVNECLWNPKTNDNSSNLRFHSKAINFAELIKNYVKNQAQDAIAIRGEQVVCRDCSCVTTLKEMFKHVRDGNHLIAKERRNLVLGLLTSDDLFASLIQRWCILSKSFFMCICCCFIFKKEMFVFDHIRSPMHFKNYELLKSGSIRPVSIRDYAMDLERSVFKCNICGLSIAKIEENCPKMRAIVRKIRKHHPCFGESTKEKVKGVKKSVNKEGNIGSKSSHKAKLSFIRIKEYKDNVNVQFAIPKVKFKTEVKKHKNGRTSKHNHSEGIKENIKKKHRKNEKVEKISASSKKTKRSGCVYRWGYEATLSKSMLICNLELFFSNSESKAENFLCIICMTNDNIENLMHHVNKEDHLKNELFILSQASLETAFCATCKYLLLGTELMFRKHFTSYYHKSRDETSVSPSKHITLKRLNLHRHDILVIKGLPSRAMSKNIIGDLLRGFGKIKHITFKKKNVEVCFAESMAVKEVVKSGSITINDHVVTFSNKNVSDTIKYIMRSGLIYLLGNCNNLIKFISGLVDTAYEIQSSSKERATEERICESLRKIIERIYPHCKCYVFGSRASGLSLSNSDIDIFLDCDHYYDGGIGQDPSTQSKIAWNVAKLLRKSKEFENVIAVINTRVPIVICHHCMTNIKCDISFRNGLGCENTSLAKLMISLDNRVKGIILFLKEWIKANNLHGRPYFSSYALTMLIIFYLQQNPHPILPTIEYLKKLYGEPQRVIGDWECGFVRIQNYTPAKINTSSVSQLILNFFTFCSNFNFYDNVISPLTGKPLHRDILQNMNINGLPEPYKKYMSKINPANYAKGDPICIMDPFDLNHNLTKGFSKSSFELFLYLCRISSGLLWNSLNSKHFSHLF